MAKSVKTDRCNKPVNHVNRMIINSNTHKLLWERHKLIWERLNNLKSLMKMIWAISGITA